MKKEIKALLNILGMLAFITGFGGTSLIADASTLQALPNTGEEIAKTGIIIGGIILVILIIIVLIRRKKENEEEE